jgi:hypothetical protein
MSTVGEKLTFYKLFSEKEFDIRIPIIQRDYAQGRSSVEEVREVFVNSLYRALQEKKPLHLDFVYGSIEDKDKFIPLDGQQRLTTLFLLHWYLARVSSQMDDLRDLLLKEEESRFTYETRISTREFCTSILQFEVPSKAELPISEIIQDQAWFSSTWLKDPSVASMLVVLDTIERVFGGTDALYELLKDPDLDLISFQFIQLEHFGLTDNLYIKMNARGKELTSFENFKAEFEEYLDEVDKREGTEFRTLFSEKIDNDWTDAFWPYKNPETNIFDEELLTFISTILINNLALKVDPNLFDDSPQQYNERIRIHLNTKTFSFTKLRKLGALEPEGVSTVIEHLNAVSGADSGIRTYLGSDNVFNEEGVFNSVINGPANNEDRLQFFAFYSYISLRGQDDQLEVWTRFVRNLAENTRYAIGNSFHRALVGIKDALLSHTHLREEIAKGTLQITGLSPAQFKEERIKALLMLKSQEWEEIITTVEDHPYFLGQIDFLLHFSGISRYFEEHKHLDWSEGENKDFMIAFKRYSSIAIQVFDRSGVVEHGDLQFERALLGIGDYTMKSKSNRSFLVGAKAQREISWKRLMRDKSEQRGYVKELFDLLDPGNIKEGLEGIINDSSVSDWRRFFIEMPDLIRVCGKDRFVRFRDEKDIMLLTKSRIYGHHREYYTYALCLILEEMGNEVNYATSIDEVWRPRIMKVNGIKALIVFNEFNESDEDVDVWQYEVEYKKDFQYFDSQKSVIEFLKSESILV